MYNMSFIVDNCPALSALCNVLKAETEYNFTPYDVIYFIRHVSIAIGCKNACSHCFSNSPSKVEQTSLEGFQRIINEIGYILKESDKPLSFFHLGASTDPASVKNYSQYLEAWRMAMPENQTIKVFTHGWHLTVTDQRREFVKFLDVLKNYQNISVVISFDEFSSFARNDWNKYLENIVMNLIAITSVIGKHRVRIEAFYTPERKECNPQCTLQFWREFVMTNTSISFKEMMNICDKFTNIHPNCSKVTSGVLKVFKDCRFVPLDIADMTRDCESIFPGGRGKNYFKDLSEDYIQMGLSVQEKKVLYSLSEYEHKYNGLIINPDGSAQLVDYYGFVLGKFLNKGQKIISYMSIYTK